MYTIPFLLPRVAEDLKSELANSETFFFGRHHSNRKVEHRAQVSPKKYTMQRPIKKSIRVITASE